MSESTQHKEEVLNLLSGVVGVVLKGQNYKLFVFGSQAGLANWKNADIDIGIEADKPIAWDKLNTIKSMVEGIPTIYQFDIVDFNRVSDQFKEIALNKTETIN